MNSLYVRYPLVWRCLYRSFTKASNSIVDIALTWLWPVPYIEVKAVEHVTPIHEAQLLTYLWCSVTGSYGERLDSTRSGTEEGRQAQDWPAPCIRCLRSYVLDSKLKKNQSPAFSRLAGFHSQTIATILLMKSNDLSQNSHKSIKEVKLNSNQKGLIR
jgi:hypothetical protein